MEQTSFKPLPNYFIIKSPIKDEIEKREKIGRFYIPPDMAYMERNLQYGLIEAIGSNAAKDFPQAVIGDLMIVHHFVQGSDKQKSKSLIHNDDEYNYYMVTSRQHNGSKVECYGVWDGEKIIPHKEYIFLQYNEETKQGAQLIQSGGLFIFDGWKETREDIEEKIKTIKGKIQSLSKSKMSDQIKAGIAQLEQESSLLTQKISKKEYTKFKVDYANPDSEINNGDTVYALNLACDTTVSVMGRQYRVVQSKYAAGIATV